MKGREVGHNECSFSMQIKNYAVESLWVTVSSETKKIQTEGEWEGKNVENKRWRKCTDDKQKRTQDISFKFQRKT
jgi:hypothetical protein